MAKKQITKRVTIVYIALEFGFWGLKDQEGNQYEPINLPKKHQEEGKEVELKLELTDEESMNMWGRVVRVL